jgi:hypothetical protein
MRPPVASWLLPPRPVAALAPLASIVDDLRGLRLGAGRLRGDLDGGSEGPVGGMLMGDQRPLYGLPWSARTTSASASAQGRHGVVSGCGRRWPLDEVEPCPWPGQVWLWDPEGSERVVCRSHAAHPSAARLVAIEEDP